MMLRQQPTKSSFFYYDTINSNYGFNSSGSYYDVKRQLKSTDYAECQGSYRSTFPHYDWALRTPYDSHYSCFVHPYGSSTSVGPVNEISGIVPAMHLIDNQVGNLEDFIYRIENNEIIIIYYIGNDTEVIIPNHIEGYPVTTLSTSAFGWSTKSALVAGDKASVELPKDAVMYYISVSVKTDGIFSGNSITASTGIYNCSSF